LSLHLQRNATLRDIDCDARETHGDTTQSEDQECSCGTKLKQKAAQEGAKITA